MHAPSQRLKVYKLRIGVPALAGFAVLTQPVCIVHEDCPVGLLVPKPGPKRCEVTVFAVDEGKPSSQLRLAAVNIVWGGNEKNTGKTDGVQPGSLSKR